MLKFQLGYALTSNLAQGATMSQEDWAKKYGAMDARLQLKYEQLPDGEQIGKRRPAKDQPANDKTRTGGSLRQSTGSH